jgi:Spx/MgsR family transcriptional regulator
MITLYGIKNCDTVKKARLWLDNNSIPYHFHDIRSDGLTKEQLEQWLDELGWETLVNKRSTTWKTLGNSVKNSLNNATAVDVIITHPTLMKRPLLDTGTHRQVGFTDTAYQALLP